MSGFDITDLLSAVTIILLVSGFGINQFKIRNELKTLKRIVLKIAKELNIELFEIK